MFKIIVILLSVFLANNLNAATIHGNVSVSDVLFGSVYNFDTGITTTFDLTPISYSQTIINDDTTINYNDNSTNTPVFLNVFNSTTNTYNASGINPLGTLNVIAGSDHIKTVLSRITHVFSYNLPDYGLVTINALNVVINSQILNYKPNDNASIVSQLSLYEDNNNALSTFLSKELFNEVGDLSIILPILSRSFFVTDLRSGTFTINADTFGVSMVSSVPIPATLLLFGTGLLGLLCKQHKFK